ncbi:hypothetical protein ACJX0J_013184, partial [Zea mays]
AAPSGTTDPTNQMDGLGFDCAISRVHMVCTSLWLTIGQYTHFNTIHVDGSRTCTHVGKYPWILICSILYLSLVVQIQI